MSKKKTDVKTQALTEMANLVSDGIREDLKDKTKRGPQLYKAAMEWMKFNGVSVDEDTNQKLKDLKESLEADVLEMPFN